MRQKIAEEFHLKENKHPFIFENDQGHVFQVMIISGDVIRVRFLTEKEKNSFENLTDHLYKDDNIKDYITTLKEEDEESSLEIETSKIRLVVTLKPTFHLSWYSSNDENTTKKQLFAQDLPYRSYGYDQSETSMWHYQRKPTDVFYYGLGERTGPLNLAGRRFRLERLDCMGYDAEKSDPLYKFCPFYIGLSNQTKSAYGIYYNNFSNTILDLGQEIDAMWGSYTYYQCDSGPLDYYMIYGPNVSSIVQNYSLITSRPRHLPPRYSFGYLASSMGYAEADNAQTQIEEFVKKCRKHDIPCDGIHLSSGYTVNEDGDRCVFTWNTSRFPDPVKLADNLKHLGVKIFANIKPWLLQKSHPDFEQVRKSKGLVWDIEKNKPSTVMQWRGDRNTMGKASYIDFTSKAGYNYWKSHVKSQLLDKGYLLWLDNNEFMLPDDSHTFACQIPPNNYANLMSSSIPFVSGPIIHTNGEIMSSKKAGTSLQTLLMIQASYDAIREYQPNERPFLITRSVTPYSNELVSQTWSGDNVTAWKTIKYNIPMGLGAGLCCMPAGYGHDIGGFAGPKPEPEMFIRWVQQGIFWPRFCIHSWNSDESMTEPWMYPEILPVIRASIHFRYKLIPYLYTLYVEHAYRQGEPLVRPVFYEHQHDTNTYNQGFDFMLGPSLLISPVYESKLTTKKVYIPANTAWYHYQTGIYYATDVDQGQWIEVPTTLKDEAAPFFVKAGSMICFGKVMDNVNASPDDKRRVQIFPERFDDATSVNGKSERKTFILYEDDGNTLYHETGQAYAEIHVWMETTETEIHVGLDIVNDGFFPYYDTIWVTCPIASETRTLIFEEQDDFGNNLKKERACNLPRIVDDDTLLAYTGLKIRRKVN